jgi:hypothetical protein
MTNVWALSEGTKHEGGSVVAVYATEESGLDALRDAAAALRQRWVEVYEHCEAEGRPWSSGQALEVYLREEWEDGGTYYCSCDYVTLRSYELR